MIESKLSLGLFLVIAGCLLILLQDIFRNWRYNAFPHLRCVGILVFMIGIAGCVAGTGLATKFQEMDQSGSINFCIGFGAIFALSCFFVLFQDFNITSEPSLNTLFHVIGIIGMTQSLLFYFLICNSVEGVIPLVGILWFFAMLVTQQVKAIEKQGGKS